MAEALIAATVQLLLEKAVSLAADRINLVLGFKKDLKALQEYAVDIQAVLADAEVKQSENPIVLRWLQKVEAAAFEANNVLDELVYESVRRQVKSRDQSRGSLKVCLFLSLSKHDISFRWRMGSKVRDINEKLRKFNGEVLDMGLIGIRDSLIPTVEVRKRQTDSLPLLNVAGREKEECEIVEMLLSGASDQRVFVLPIVGMGGLGKTTLAKSVYNREKVKDRFGKRCWICVSDNFDVTEMFRGILESLKKGGKVEVSGRDAIVQQIQKELDEERFLFVLDDVWNEDTKLWDDFFTSLVALSSASGSCCILTTRLQTTANLVSTHSPFLLGKLSDEACWSVLTERATKGGDVSDELKVHSSQILRRCQGLPLAANVIGGLLSLHRREDWLSIVENKVFKVSEDVGDEIMPILRLSFDYLPSPSIKKCFAYCSIYAKDMNMIGEALVQLWLAEGFIQEEDVGCNYLTILLLSSLFEEGHDESGRQFYKMHDLVHDLGESVSNRTQSNLESNYQARHLALSIGECSMNARSPLVRIVKGEISNEMLLKYKCLYILDLTGSEILSLARSVSKLKHLRYLVLSHFEITILPECLCELYNLQTLRLDYCGKLRHLPRRLNNLINLRHLNFITGDYGARMPPNMGLLTRLQTLKYFNVMEENGHGIEELGFMKFLEGCLEIRNLEFVKGKEVAKLANLVEKKNLLQLKLMWSHDVCHDIDNCDDVLEGLEPHPGLGELEIWSFGGVRFPQWFGKLSGLVKLKLDSNKNCSELPTLGHLPFLETLEILHLTNVGYIGDSFYSDEGSRLEGKVFPALKSLVLSDMENLCEWKKCNHSVVVFPKLAHLVIEMCSQLTITPTYFPSLDRLEVGEDTNVFVARDIIGSNADSLKTLVLRSISGLSNLADVVVNHLTVLKKLEICNCDDLVDIPSSTLECCKSLESFRVFKCSNLVSCPLNSQQTPCLSYVRFNLCPSLFVGDALMPRGFRYLTKLRDLSVGPFSDDSIKLFDWSGLVVGCSSTLQNLGLNGSGVEHSPLPQQLQHLASLEGLQLEGFGSVEALPDWFGNLASLRHLHLYEFPKLQRLPSEQAVARLRNMERLVVLHCPIFKQNWGHKTSSEIFGRPNVHVRIS